MAKRWLLGSCIAVAMAVCLATSSAQVQAQGKGNSAAAQACKNGGWRTLTNADGQPFQNQGDCVNYAARGGTIFSSNFVNACHSFLGYVEANGATQTCWMLPDEFAGTDYVAKICTESGGVVDIVEVGHVNCTF